MSPSKPLRLLQLLARYRALSETGQREVTELILSRGRTAQTARTVRVSQLTHKAIGRLIFLVDGTDGLATPLHNMKVQLWDHDIVTPDDFLGESETDSDGSFEIRYDPADAGEHGSLNLYLRIYEAHHTYSRSGKAVDTYKLIHKIDLEESISPQRDGTDGEIIDFGTCRIAYWEYDPASRIPRLLIPEQGEPPTSYSPGRALAMLESVTPLETIKAKHLLEHGLNREKPSLEQIQDDYPENLTVRLEKERPGATRSDEYFGLRLMNGMSASLFDRDPADPSLYWLHHHWNSYEHDGVHALPNVDLRFELRDGQLYPVEITLRLRQPGATAADSPTEKLTFTPRDGDRWQQAKRVARVSAALAAELDVHLVQTHLNVEQYTIAAMRNLRKNPVRYLLFPHLKEVVLINHSADSFLLGPTGYITRASALTAEALVERLGQVLGTLDWQGFQPQEPISEKHTYARAAGLFWQVLTEYVDTFFDEHLAGIRQHWFEVHRFSADLLTHSAPYFLCHYLETQLPQEDGWFSRRERMKLEIPRHRHGGVARALQPITLRDEASDEGVENLKQVCRYVIFHATFRHTWSNNKQYDDGGEIRYSGLGLRYGERGVLAPESDSSIAPPPDRASELLWIGGMLSKTAYGFILHNEEHDIHPAFIAGLRRRADEFAELGVDVRRINSRINI